MLGPDPDPLLVASRLPLAPPRGAYTTTPSALPPALPQAPPKARKASLFDDDHRRQTLLTLGASLASGRNFGDGLSAALGNLAGLQGDLTASQKQQHAIGGPDDSFEIITDPQTGQRTFKPIAAVQDYVKAKGVKPKDSADMNGRAMHSLLQVPEADRPKAYAAMRMHPEFFGIDPATMPAEYDPQYVGVTANMGMTVAQAQARALDDAAAKAKAERDAALLADRARRTDAYVTRSGALTTQGQQRLSISAAKGRGGGKAAAPGSSGDPYEYRILADGTVQRRRKSQ